MKRVVVYLLLVILFGAYSCQQLTHAQFNVSYNTSFVLPAEPLTDVTDSIVVPVITNVDSVLKQNNTSTNLVRSVMLQTFTLSITAPPGQTFTFLQNARVFIFTSTQPPVEIANMNNVPNTGTVLNMNTDDVDLKPYLLSDSFQLKLIGTAGQPVKAPVNINAHLTFHFVADLLAVVGG